MGSGLDRYLERPLSPVLDTQVLDKQVVPRRRNIVDEQGRKVRGARVLRTVCEAHGLSWDEASAHGAEYDAMQAARVAYVLGRDFPTLGMPLADLHERQIKWAAEQAAELQAYFRRRDPAAVVDGAWPVRPYEGQGALA